MKTFVKNVFLDGNITDLEISNGIIAKIAPGLSTVSADSVFDADNAIAIPAFYNCHTHAPMNLFRGFADDLALFDWLENHIWPAEAKLTAQDIRRGSEMAIAEMIRTGTVFFNDMYWHEEEVLDAAVAAGIRACIGPCIIDGPDGHPRQTSLDELALVKSRIEALTDEDKSRIRLAYAPHSVYTVSEDSLCMIAAMAKDDPQAFIHVHASETADEVTNCIAKYGISPIALLDRCGLLDSRTILAHCVHLSPADCELIAARGATISHQPCSNLKLCSGLFNYAVANGYHCKIAIGTDGAASNNSLSMFDEMKTAALVAKCASGDPRCGSAAQIFASATSIGSAAFGFNAGRIVTGAFADFILLDPRSPQMQPCANLASNVVYAADSSCIKAVFCNGKPLFSQYPNE